MINLNISGEVCLNESWGNTRLQSILNRLQNIQFNDKTSIRIHFFDYILTVSGQGDLACFEDLRKIINDLRPYLTPKSMITIANNKRDYAVRLARRATPLDKVSMELVPLGNIKSLSC